MIYYNLYYILEFKVWFSTYREVDFTEAGLVCRLLSFLRLILQVLFS